MQTSRVVSDQHTHKLGRSLALIGASVIQTRTNRYNADVYKKRYKTFLIVLFAILHFFQGRKIMNLIETTILFAEKQFYNKLNFSIQVRPQMRKNRGVHL